MFSQYFGHYILNKGLIDKDALKKALELQNSTHVKLGVLAINSGYMTAKDVNCVHEKQTVVDKRFGELAVEMGFLSKDQLDDLLNNQKKGHLQLGQCLIDHGYLNIEDFQSALKEYKDNYNLTDSQINAIQENNIDEILKSLLSFDEIKTGNYYYDYISLLIRNVIRFIDNNHRIEINELNKEYASDWLITQGIYGEKNMSSSILLDNNAFINIARKYSQEEIESIDELAKASVSEFLNLHNGIFLVNMSNNGIELQLLPPQIEENKTVSASNKGYIISFYCLWGNFDVLIA